MTGRGPRDLDVRSPLADTVRNGSPGSRIVKRLFLLLLATVPTGCGKPIDDGSVVPGPAEESSPLLDAFYLLQFEDVRGESSNGEPVVNLADYGFLVCNAGIDRDSVRVAAPHATAFGYLSPHQVPLWGQNDQLFNDYRALFSNSDYWTDASGNRISTWPNTEELLYTAANATKLAQFVVARWDQWDGLYLDDLWGELVPLTLAILPITEAEYPQAQADWAIFRDTFVRTVRLTYDRPIVANVGPLGDGVAHLDLDGLASEEWWPERTDDILNDFSRYDPAMCISWEWDAGDAARRGNIRYR